MDDAFINAFFDIDKDGSGAISVDELRAYATRNEYDEKFVDKWVNLFGVNDCGEITLGAFCERLGLEHAEIEEKQRQYQHSKKPQLPSDVTVLNVDMLIEEQIRVVELTKEGLQKFDGNLKEVAKYVKQNMDKEYGAMFATFAFRGQYWAYYAYEPGQNFNYKIGNNIYMVFKVPLP